MKLVPLNTRVKCKHPEAPTHAMVDDEDYDRLIKFNWHAHKHHSNCTFYVIRNSKYIKGQKRTVIKMHRDIMGVINVNETIDHIDHCGWNNQKNNLRKCSSEENIRNINSRKGSSSKYLGVWFSKRAEKWQAKIVNKAKRVDLGYFLLEKDAAHAYDVAAKDLHGEYANLNFKNNEYTPIHGRIKKYDTTITITRSQNPG